VQGRRAAIVQQQNSLFCSRPSRRNLFLFFLLPAIFLASGCKSERQTRLTATQVHAITRDMMRASSNFAKKPGSVTSRLQFDGSRPDRVDHLFVTLPVGASEQARRESVSQLIQSLDGVATSNHLTRDPETISGPLLLLNFRSAGAITQSVHIIAPVGSPVGAALPSRRDNQHGPARLAIILDDLGSDRVAADAIFALPYHLTISVLPNHPHSTEIAEEAQRRGFEVMLHLPMQSVANETPEARELRPGMPADEIPPLFEQMMQSVPGATGVNNHQGSQATADPALMNELMPVLQSWNLFYIDSRTTAATVAYDTAQHEGVRSAFRNVPFLDDVAEVPAVRKQLELALRGAEEKGAAIAIGHPHPATLQVLREVLPQAKSRGIELVFASELVH
jgi:uncharacterized protein